MDSIKPISSPAKLLIIDDDAVFCRVLVKALQHRGYEVKVAHNPAQAIEITAATLPQSILLDLNLAGESGLGIIGRLKSLAPQARIVVLTGYASIATAVEAVKLGATQYLAKPANADEIVAAFGHSASVELPLNTQPSSVDRLEWEHIQRVLQEQQGNISATARLLNMHRRTLQRKLGKRPVA